MRAAPTLGLVIAARHRRRLTWRRLRPRTALGVDLRPGRGREQWELHSACGAGGSRSHAQIRRRRSDDQAAAKRLGPQRLREARRTGRDRVDGGRDVPGSRPLRPGSPPHRLRLALPVGEGRPYYYVAPANVPGFPSGAGHVHTLRLTRLRPSSTWLVEVDDHIVDRIVLPGSSRGLPMPRTLLYASNRDGRLNRGSFRFTQVHALPAGGQTWSRFPHGKTWLYTDHPKYTYVGLSKTSFIAKNR